MSTTTRKRTRKGASPAARAARDADRDDHYDALAAELKEFQATYTEDEILALIAPFLKVGDGPGYSFANACHIVVQDPDATEVHAYWAWRALGRQVGTYPDGRHGITILGYRGSDKDKRDAAEAERKTEAPAAGRREGEMSSDDLKAPKRHFDLDTVHDVRFTTPLLCGECAGPIRLTGTERVPAQGKRKARSLHTYTHTTVKAEHRAWPAPRPQDGEPAEGAGEPAAASAS